MRADGPRGCVWPPATLTTMSILVAYATHSGATRTLADAIVAQLRKMGIAGEAVDVRDNPDPSGHDAVILGSGIRMDSLERSAVTWASRHRRQLASMPVAVFSCSGSASDPAKAGRQQGMDSFVADCGFDPVAVRNFPGWVILEKLPLHEKALMTAMRVPRGDFRDLEAVAAWTREILPALEG